MVIMIAFRGVRYGCCVNGVIWLMNICMGGVKYDGEIEQMYLLIDLLIKSNAI